MIAIRCGIALSIFCAAAPGALLLVSAPADAKRGRGPTVEVGPIWNQQDAERKCSKAARAAGAKWTGQWWTTRPGRMSVCEIGKKRGGGRTVEVGPIWNDQDAETKCRKAARAAGKKWTGQWWTTRPGKMSVCELRKK